MISEVLLARFSKVSLGFRLFFLSIKRVKERIDDKFCGPFLVLVVDLSSSSKLSFCQ